MSECKFEEGREFTLELLPVLISLPKTDMETVEVGFRGHQEVLGVVNLKGVRIQLQGRLQCMELVSVLRCLGEPRE